MLPTQPRRSVRYGDSSDDGSELYLGEKAGMANHLHRCQIFHHLRYRLTLVITGFVCINNWSHFVIQYFTIFSVTLFIHPEYR
jgi:hypothetical protein